MNDNSTNNQKNAPKSTTTEGTVRTYHCNDCGGVIYRHEVFCSSCGKQLDHFDFED